MQATEAESFALMQILDLGCQSPDSVLEVELRNALNPDAVCAKWVLPDWAEQLAADGTAVSIDKATGGAYVHVCMCMCMCICMCG